MQPNTAKTRPGVQKLDARARAVITELCKHGPSNLSLVARHAGIPVETLRYRYKSLIAKGTFQLSIFTSYLKTGLVRASLLVEANKPRRTALAQALESLDFWTYIAPCWGAFEGFYAVYTIPKPYTGHFAKYVEKLLATGLARRYTLAWTSDPVVFPPDFSWYDEASASWHFDWERWKSEFARAAERRPAAQAGETRARIRIDDTDLAIVGLMEQRPLVSFSEIGRELGMTSQAVHYHYANHLKKQGIIAGYAPTMLPYVVDVSDMLVLIIRFPTESGVEKFARSTSGKPFIRNFTVTTNGLTVLAHTYVPKFETRALISALYDLAAQGELEDFYYVTLDVAHFKAWSIRFENFKDGKWQYPSEEYDRRLNALIATL